MDKKLHSISPISYLLHRVLCLCVRDADGALIYTIAGLAGEVATLGSPPVGPVASSSYSAVPESCSAIIKAFILKLFYLCRLAMQSRTSLVFQRVF